jgi:DNA-binding MarR family transcriptional regulator
MVRKKASAGDGVRWLNDEQQLAWRSLTSLLHQLGWALECQLERDADLSFIEYITLARLSEEPDLRLRMSELAFLTHASLSRLSHLVKRLEARGYLARQPDPRDGRVTVVALTDAGYTKLEATAPGHVACVRALVIDALSTDERAQLRDACDRIVARIEASDWKLDLT